MILYISRFRTDTNFRRGVAAAEEKVDKIKCPYGSKLIRCQGLGKHRGSWPEAGGRWAQLHKNDTGVAVVMGRSVFHRGWGPGSYTGKKATYYLVHTSW